MIQKPYSQTFEYLSNRADLSVDIVYHHKGYQCEDGQTELIGRFGGHLPHF